MKRLRIRAGLIAGVAAAAAASFFVAPLAQSALAQEANSQDATGQPAQAPQVSVSWSETTNVSHATPTFQVVVMPQMVPGSPLRDPILGSMAALQAKNMRLVPWFPTPRLSVAELSPPTRSDTSWDFSRIDPQVVPFLEATKGRDPVLNFSVIPRWMFKTTGDVTIPADVNKLVWNYSRTWGTGTAVTGGRGDAQLVDPTGKQVGDYYARLVSWYTKGGFTDENGVFHKSDHHYALPWWEVLSELDQGLTVEQYTKLYDVIVTSIRSVSPQTKFTGLQLWCPADSCTPENIEYFLDPKNHAPGIPIDAIGWHTYARPAPEETPDHWQYSFFENADGLLERVRFVEQIRRRLQPNARVDLNEVGCILPSDMTDVGRGSRGLPPLETKIPDLYWNACGAYYAYIYAGFARLGINVVVRKSQLYGYPGQFTTVSMLNADTGLPNARYQVLNLLVRNFQPGDKLVRTNFSSSDVLAQAFVTSKGKRLLLVNKRNRPVSLSVQGATSQLAMDVVDPQSGGQPPRHETVSGGRVTLNPFAVAVLAID